MRSDCRVWLEELEGRRLFAIDVGSFLVTAPLSADLALAAGTSLASVEVAAPTGLFSPVTLPTDLVSLAAFDTSTQLGVTPAGSRAAVNSTAVPSLASSPATAAAVAAANASSTGAPLSSLGTAITGASGGVSAVINSVLQGP